MTNLLPCPFCSGKATRQDIDYDTMGAEPTDQNYGGSFIECDGCGACTRLHFDRKENLDSCWNERTPVCGYSCDDVNLSGDKKSIDAAYEAFHSHGQIEELRRNLRHWREECGKLHAQLANVNATLAEIQGRCGGCLTDGEKDETIRDLNDELERLRPSPSVSRPQQSTPGE